MKEILPSHILCINLLGKGNDFVEKVKLILDTDMGSDYDDAGAIAVMHNLARKGDVDILAVTYCSSDRKSAVAINALNSWYGKDNIPVGVYEEKEFLVKKHFQRFTYPLAKSYLENHEMPEIKNATKVLRKAISENKDITICVIGMLNNIAELLKSGPDEISELTGEELVRNNVKNMYVMGGNFKDETYCEYNIKTDVESANYVAMNFPMPIIYCGFEIGHGVVTGINLKNEPDDNLTKMAYYYGSGMSEAYQRDSYDPITVYCAVNQDNDFYNVVTGVKVTFGENGETLFENGGKDSFLVENNTAEEIRDEIDKYII